jgi:hypothetical protein
MTTDERAAKIERYGQAHGLLMAALAAIPRELWHQRSDVDPWTIHEIVMHITDSEANSYVRCRRAIAEPGSSVMAYDEMGWASALHYADQDVEAAVDLFRLLRGQTYRLIHHLPDATWAHTIQHPENGLMTLDDWLDVYIAHVPEHLAQIARIVEALQHANA